MADISAFYAKVTDDPLTMAFEEEKRTMPPLGGMPGSMPKWEGGTFADFGAKAFMERPERPLALYLHVPFCHHHCTFCPFYINQTNKNFSENYTKLLLKEISHTAEVLKDVIHKREVEAVYFGGGTPTDLEKDDMTSILLALRDSFKFKADAEVTIEGRNRGFTAEKGKAWFKAGANRYSIGVQAANTELRQKLGRISTREEVRDSLNGLGESGASVVIDLLYALPGQNIETIVEDVYYLSRETNMGGLDLYELRLFPNGPLDKAIKLGKMPQIPDFLEKAKLFGAAYDALVDCGFELFSPRHWRRDKKERSIYNTLARMQADMIPFGSAAGGRLGTIGLGNARDIKAYTEMVERGEKPLSRIMPSPLDEDRNPFGRMLNESLEELRMPDLKKFPAQQREDVKKLFNQWKKAGLLTGDVESERMGFTQAGSFWTERMRKLLTDFVGKNPHTPHHPM